MLCWKSFAGQHILANNSQAHLGPMWSKGQQESLVLRQREHQVPVREQTARRITAHAQRGRPRSKATSPKKWSVEEVLDVAKTLSNDEMQRLKDEVIELAKTSARSTTPPELAAWNIKLAPTTRDEKYDYYNNYMLEVKGQEYRVMASYFERIKGAGTVESRCGKLQIADLLIMEEHSYFTQYNTCYGYTKLRKKLGMDEDQFLVLLDWLFEIIGSDVDLSLVEQALENSNGDEDDDEEEEERS